MSIVQSRWPRRIALTYVGLVFLAWAVALLTWSPSDFYQALPIVLGLPWSLVFFSSGGGLSLPGIFCTGILNAVLLHVLIRGSLRRSAARRYALLLPPET